MVKALLAASFSHPLLLGQTEVRSFGKNVETQRKLMDSLDPQTTLAMSGVEETSPLYQLVDQLLPGIEYEVRTEENTAIQRSSHLQLTNAERGLLQRDLL